MRILYVTRSSADGLDDDATHFAIGLARMAQHAGQRVQVLVEDPRPGATDLPPGSVDGVTVRRMAAGSGREASVAAGPDTLGGQAFDVMHVLDARAHTAAERLWGLARTPVVNVDALPAADADGGAAITKVARIVQAAACCIAPDAAAAAGVRARWPSRSCDVVVPGVDLLAIAAGRQLSATTDRLRVGWTGAPWLPLQQVLGQLGLQGRAISNLPAQRQASLHDIDLLCLPSGAPRHHVFEAQAAGLPVLIDAGVAGADTVRRSGAGAVLAAGDSHAWADALRRWANDASVRAGWRRAVRPPPRIEETAFLYESLYRREAPGA